MLPVGVDPLIIYPDLLQLSDTMLIVDLERSLVVSRRRVFTALAEHFIIIVESD